MEEIPVQPQPKVRQTEIYQKQTQVSNQSQSQQEKKKGGLISRILLTILLAIVFLFTSILAWMVVFGTGSTIGSKLLGFPADFGGFYISLGIGIIFIPILTIINTVLTFKATDFLKSEDVKHRSIGWALLLLVISIVLFPLVFLPIQ